MTADYPRVPRTEPTRNPQRVSYDRATVHAVLDEALVCHLGFVVDGRPVVLPQLHARIGERLYLHGSTGARALRSARDGGLPVCVTVTLVDGLVLARSQFNHSVNYRSVVVLGTPRRVEGDEKWDALHAIVDHIAPGRWEEARQPSEKEMKTTEVVALALEECSAKVRSGPPIDSPQDRDLDVPIGVIPLELVRGDVRPS
jgi:nitroimidazol reductase NimA-like FMN-containing flavoprotein (pyridoxamine 5'-phosphate oxidase superfamily)